jgi:hypothetical protein
MGNQIVIGSMACVYKAGAWLRRYLNGDVEFLVEWNPWSHLTWNNTDTRQRGPEGYPTTPCQGVDNLASRDHLREL